MAEGGFSLERLAEIYTDTWLQGCEELGVPEAGQPGATAVKSFVWFVRRLQEESK